MTDVAGTPLSTNTGPATLAPRSEVTAPLATLPDPPPFEGHTMHSPMPMHHILPAPPPGNQVVRLRSPKVPALPHPPGKSPMPPITTLPIPN